MRIFIFILLIVISSCRKEVVDDEENESNITVVSLIDSVRTDETFEIDIFGDGVNKIKFMSKEHGGSSGHYSRLNVQGIGGVEIAYVQKRDTSWFLANDTLWEYHIFNQAIGLNLFDTISNELTFTSNNVLIAEFTAPGWGTYLGINRYDLIGIGEIYFAARLEETFIWIKVEVLGTSKLNIYKYGYSNCCNALIISD